MTTKAQILFASCVFLFWKSSEVSALQKSSFYKLIPDEHRDVWQYLYRLPADTEFKCYTVCLRVDECAAAVHNSTSHECILLEPQTGFSTPFLISPSMKFMRKFQHLLIRTMVFRTSAGRGSEFYNPWINGSYVSLSTEGVDNLSQKINYTYKHPCLKHWNKLDILQVKLTLWESETEVVTMVFSARGSTKNDWFAHDRILESSFVDLQNSSVYDMSLKGWKKTRLFYIREHHDGCEEDRGWMCFKERTYLCKWATQPPYPAFIYSKSKHIIKWHNNTNLGLADDLVISLSIQL